jgi:hypothetical protein
MNGFKLWLRKVLITADQTQSKSEDNRLTAWSFLGSGRPHTATYCGDRWKTKRDKCMLVIDTKRGSSRRAIFNVNAKSAARLTQSPTVSTLKTRLRLAMISNYLQGSNKRKVRNVVGENLQAGTRSTRLCSQLRIPCCQSSPYLSVDCLEKCKDLGRVSCWIQFLYKEKIPDEVRHVKTPLQLLHAVISNVRVELQAVKPAMSPNRTVVSTKRSAKGLVRTSTWLPLSSFIKALRLASLFRSPYACLKASSPFAFSPMSRSRTLSGKSYYIIIEQ